ncbi:hypothetical protein RB195_006472 [Necator americanus]|uniref:Uncharacterized protein n=1 Tax=Necator americanus TaxID=51031 RepID=A0ABR1BWH6_NECAM
MHAPIAALQETRIRDRPTISTDNHTIHSGDADERKVEGCALTARSNNNNVVEKYRPKLSRCAFVRLRNHRRLKLWVVSAHAPSETAENHNKGEGERHKPRLARNHRQSRRF